MKMKKLLACLLAISAMVSTVGCNFGGGNSSSDSVTSEGQGGSSELAGIPEATVPQEDFQAH